jgi:hypothetical protein
MVHDSKRDQSHSALTNPSLSLSPNQRLASPKEVLRLAPRLLSLFPQRVMLNSRELAAVVKLEQSSVPVPQLLSWATELYQAKPQVNLSFLLQQLTQRAQRWQSSRIGEKYGASQLNSSQLETAFDELLADLGQAEAEAHEQDIKQVMIWLIESVQHLKERSLLSTSDLEYLDLEGIFSAFHSLSKEAQERFFIAAPESLKRQVYQRVHALLEKESHRTRPQDFIIAQTAVWWSITRSELNLPPLRLRLFDGW